MTELIAGLLEVDPEKRLTVAKVLSHPWVVPNSPISPSKLTQIAKFAILEDDEFSSDEEVKTFSNVNKESYYIDEATFDKINQITYMHDYNGRERTSSFKQKENLDISLSRLKLRRRMTKQFSPTIEVDDF